MSGKNLVKVLIVSIVLSLILFEGHLGYRPALGQEAPITIGTVYEATGPMSPYGLSSIAAVQLAVDEINAAGGVLGRKFKIIQRDNEGNVEKGVRLMRDLILREKVDFVMGPIGSNVALGMCQVAKEHKNLLISTNSRTTKITVEQGHRYLISVGSRTEMTGRSAAYFVGTNPKWQKIWTIASDFEYGRDVMNEFVNCLKTAAPNAKVIGQSWPPLTEVDMSPYATQILAAKPDFVMGCILGGALAALIKQGKSYGFFDKLGYMDASALDVGVLEPLKLETPEGIYGCSTWHWNFIDNPRNKVFVKEMIKRLKRYPEHAGEGAYTGVYMLMEAIKKAGKTDTEAVIDAFERITYDSLTGPVSIRKIDHQADIQEFICKSKKIAGFPFAQMEFVYKSPMEKLMFTSQEVEQRRQKYQKR